MLKVENVSVHNAEGATRGMRNPMNSWNLSDSFYANEEPVELRHFGNYVIGDKDFELGCKLAKAGTDHRKFLRQIMVCIDITAPLYWWKEFDTYKVGTVANSCSTMHKLTSKPIERSDFSFDNGVSELYRDEIISIISFCEHLRNKYLATNDKDYWRLLIQMLPEAYNQKRTVTLNYEVLANIYKARRCHKLSEWHTFCDWIESLPCFEWINNK